MSDKLTTFFYYKVDLTGNLRFGGMNVLSRTLSPINVFSCVYDPSDNDDGEESDSRFAEIYEEVYELLNEKVWIGHDIIKSDIPELEKACEKIGKKFPRAKDIIDTSYFVASNTKLAKLAVLFGLGEEGDVVNNDCYRSIKAIKLCGEVLSLYEPDEMNKYVVNKALHPMISYLKDKH